MVIQNAAVPAAEFQHRSATLNDATALFEFKSNIPADDSATLVATVDGSNVETTRLLVDQVLSSLRLSIPATITVGDFASHKQIITIKIATATPVETSLSYARDVAAADISYVCTKHQA